jgi:hypothetical protein
MGVRRAEKEAESSWGTLKEEKWMILIQLLDPAEHKSPLMMSLHSSPHNQKK